MRPMSVLAIRSTPWSAELTGFKNETYSGDEDQSKKRLCDDKIIQS